ncbi:BppU family phage baseplate upper protein, partial [Parabacteroides merdae]|nr:BppU family phage baseplate upper protein [Parabacteroides merdae]
MITLAINNFHFKLDIEREDYIPKFRLKQYDTAIFYVSLYKNGLPYNFENQQIKMFVKKQDGTIVYQEDNISIEDDEVKINVKNQALVCSGLTYAELEFKSSDGQVTSSTFLYEVKEKVGSDKAIESVTDIATLDKLKKYMEDAKKELERFKIELSKI